LGEQVIKAKVPAEIGLDVAEDVWVECPLEAITLFDENGSKLEVELTVA